MKLSIRYDLTFQEALIVHTDAQNHLCNTPEEEIAGTPQAEIMVLEAQQRANRAMMARLGGAGMAG